MTVRRQGRDCPQLCEDNPASKYQFIDGPRLPGSGCTPPFEPDSDCDGFWICACDRNPVFVECRPAGFGVTAMLDSEPAGTAVTVGFGLFEWYLFSEFVAEGLMRFWEPPAGPRRKFDIHRWAARQTGGAIGKRLHERWRQHLERVDPQVRAVQKAVFAATLQHAPITELAELYRRKFIAQDIINNRAAAIAALHIVRLAGAGPRAVSLPEGLVPRKDPSYRVQVKADDGQMDVALDRLADWPSLFSPTGMPYRSLNRTLTNGDVLN